MGEEDIDIYGEDDGFTVAMGPEEVRLVSFRGMMGFST